VSVETMNAQTPRPTAFDELPRSKIIATVAVLMLTLLLAALDQTIVGTAMPRIIADLQGFEQYAWVATAYMVASTAIVPIVGKLSDLFGRRLFLIGGVVSFLVASVLCGVSVDMVQLILFRGLQGLGAGVMMAMCFTVVGDLFPPAKRGRIQGLFGSVWGLASVIGPPVGGLLTDRFSWRWVFYVNVPLGLVALAALVFLFPKIAPSVQRRQIDYLGAVTLLCWVVPLLLALSWGGVQYAWTSIPIVGLLIVTIGGLAAFVYAERHAPEPILPPGLLANRTIAVAVTMSALMGAGMFSVILFTPLWVQGVIGASATESGTVLLPMTIGIVIANLLSGQIMSRTGRYRFLALGGFVMIVAGMALLATMDVQTSYTTVVLNMIVVGVGLGTVMPILAVVVQSSVPRSMLGVASSAQQFFRSIGATLGIAVLGSVLVGRFGALFMSGLPADLVASISPERLAALGNPQALLNPDTGASLRDAVAQAGADPASAEIVMGAIRQALAVSLHDVYAVAAVVVLIGLVVTFFLPEIPLEQGKGERPPAFEAA
jgi:EmrB/QacA subfamily drug resistance transporter